MQPAPAFQPKRRPPKIGNVVTIKIKSLAYGIEVQGVYGDSLHGRVIEAPHREVMRRAVDIGQWHICCDTTVSVR